LFWEAFNVIHSISLIGPHGNTISVAAAGSGPALFLLHGFPVDHHLWLDQFRELSAAYHVIAPEMRGFGSSTLPDGGYSLKDLADDVEFVRQQLVQDQSIHLCGLSMGGYVALEYWHAYRDKLLSLTLLNTKPTADDETARAGRLAMADRALEQGTWPAVQPMLEKLVGHTTAETKPGVVGVVEAMMQAQMPAAVAAAQRAMAERRDFSSLLDTLRLPVLVVTGDEDTLAPPLATSEWAAQIPDSRFVCLERCGHLSCLEKPEEVNTLLRKL
jgi:pimeloyl-ACP methyl ester carboxylesterase